MGSITERAANRQAFFNQPVLLAERIFLITQDEDPVDEFWRWFEDHLSNIAVLNDAEMPFWDVVLQQLKRIDSRLWFELSHPNGKIRELIITAAGHEDAFPIVDAAVARAPKIDGWKFISLKPAMGFDFQTSYEGITFDPRLMWFLPMLSSSRPQNLRLRVGVPNLTAEIKPKADNAVLVILDTALGERAAAADIQYLEVVRLPDSPDDNGYIELHELPKYIEYRKRKFRTA